MWTCHCSVSCIRHVAAASTSASVSPPMPSSAQVNPAFERSRGRRVAGTCGQEAGPRRSASYGNGRGRNEPSRRKKLANSQGVRASALPILSTLNLISQIEKLQSPSAAPSMASAAAPPAAPTPTSPFTRLTTRPRNSSASRRRAKSSIRPISNSTCPASFRPSPARSVRRTVSS